MRLISNLYSTFNAFFNIQLRIQHSTIHFIFNSFFASSIIYSTISTIYSILKHSTIHSTFNSFEPSLLLVSDTDSLLVKNVAAARMPATKIEAYEDDTRLHFDVESGPPRFLGSVLQRTEQISQTKVDEEIVEHHIVIVYQTVRLLRTPRDSSSNINAYDKETLDNLSSAFSDVLSALQQCLARAAVSLTTIVWL